MSTQKISAQRLGKALAAHGIDVKREGQIIRVARRDAREIQAEILLPESLPLELKAVQQLLNFAAIRHPHGGEVCRACATPDFHPGSDIPVGSVLLTSSDMIVPQAIGTDINCGMRLHVLDLDLEQFLAGKARLTELLKNDLLHGARNLPTTPEAMTALFKHGLAAFWQVMRKTPEGLFAELDFDQVVAECARLHPSATVAGLADYAPPSLQDRRRGKLRDPGLASLGGGNHFCEFQVIDQVYCGQRAWDWGVRQGQIALMLHTGSRDVGFFVGQRWMDKAKAAWPAGLKHPASGLYALTGDLVDDYLGAMHAAAHYADANRALIAELVRKRIRQVYGDQAMPLVYDLPHNIVLREAEGNLHRKGATPAHDGQPLLIPGSMGDHSFLLEGLGHAGWLNSASHGAGRAVARQQMKRRAAAESALAFECISLREERKVEEAPSAYKPIGPVIEVQEELGLLRKVARLAPLMTFKA